ncbi:hypothetical protein BBP40_009459 [Aspergillus hancockii]|nr:hypothetical protein BBP40_009459 [Aspergillus hancockii]
MCGTLIATILYKCGHRVRSADPAPCPPQGRPHNWQEVFLGMSRNRHHVCPDCRNLPNGIDHGHANGHALPEFSFPPREGEDAETSGE